LAGSRIRVRMRARAIDEPHRASSQLELLFDLTFVVGIAAVTAQFAHSIADGHALDGLAPFLQVFFAIWWAWMNFTWFASSYDTDDVPYRLLTMVQMAGVLVLAAGVPAAADHGDYIGVTSGYLIMRIGLVAQWLRVAAEEPPDRRTALRYGGGISALQVGWFLLLFLVDQGVLSSSGQRLFFVALAILELTVPWWAERTRATNWHPHHIAERYGLFTIILLGESVLAATAGAQRALEDSEVTWSLIVISAAGLVLLFALWWLYFLQPAGAGLAERRDRSYVWGYGHYGIFASLAALGAGLEVAVEQTGHHLEASPTAVSYAIAIPTGVFLMLVWAVHAPLVETPTIPAAASFAGVFIILLLPLATPSFGVPGTTAATAAVCALLVAVTIGSVPASRRA